MIEGLVFGLIGLAVAVFVLVADRRLMDDLRGENERSLEYERARTTQLLSQVQANAQGFQHYPTYGPIVQEPVKQFMYDDTGLIQYEVDPDGDFVDAD